MSSSRERRYIYHSDLEGLYNGFSVEKHAVRLIAAGVTAPITVQVLAGDNPELTADWAPLTNGQGNFVVVAADNTDLTFMKPGRYRLDPVGLAAAGQAVIWMQDITHQALDDLDFQYTVTETYTVDAADAMPPVPEPPKFSPFTGYVDDATGRPVVVETTDNGDGTNSYAFFYVDAAGALVPATTKAKPCCDLAAAFLDGQYIHLPTGLPVWTIASRDDNGQVTHDYYYIDANGDTIMATAGSVGTNPATPVTQAVGAFSIDYFANGADLTKTAADIIADAITAGAQLFGADGVGQALAATDFIAKIDMDLKPINGHGDDGGTQVTATAADATFTTNGSTTDLDPGGSRTAGDIKGENGFYRNPNFQQLVVKDGSIVTVMVDFATVPA